MPYSTTLSIKNRPSRKKKLRRSNIGKGSSIGMTVVKDSMVVFQAYLMIYSTIHRTRLFFMNCTQKIEG